MSRIIITGAAGFVGSHLCLALVEAGHDVIGIDNLSTGKRKNVDDRVEFYPYDITFNNPNFSHLFEGVEYVYHLAALARIQPSITDPARSHDTNVNGTLNVLEACRKHGVKRVIFSSSSSVYDGEELPTNEFADQDAKNPYTLQKQIGESYIVLYNKLYGLDYVIFRYFNVFGPGQILDGAYAAVVGIFLRQAAQGKPLTIFGDGSKRRDFTHVDDVTAANLLALTLPADIYNVGTGDDTSIKELADSISPNQVHLPNNPGEVQATLCDSSKLQAQGWKPKLDILDPKVLKEMRYAYKG